VQASAAPPPEHAPLLQQLPDAIRTEVPPIVIGGYIYSTNPADRLVLIDKVVRHEGDEAAPGVRIERLLPRAAILSYKGYRFQVGY
jgi:general secretion pathway protein B